MGNLHVFAKALARKATISNVSSALCVLFRPRELLKKVVPTVRHLLQSSPKRRKAPGGGGGGTPLYKVYRYVPPQRVWLLSRFGLK